MNFTTENLKIIRQRFIDYPNGRSEGMLKYFRNEHYSHPRYFDGVKLNFDINQTYDEISHKIFIRASGIIFNKNISVLHEVYSELHQITSDDIYQKTILSICDVAIKLS